MNKITLSVQELSSTVNFISSLLTTDVVVLDALARTLSEISGVLSKLNSNKDEKAEDIKEAEVSICKIPFREIKIEVLRANSITGLTVSEYIMLNQLLFL